MRNASAIMSLVLIFALTSYAQGQQKLHPRLTIEQLINIKHPSDPVWSPDGKHVAFVWDRAGVSNFYVANADGQGQPIALTSYLDGEVGGAFWSQDGSVLYFPHAGELWQVPVAGGEPPSPGWTPETRQMDVVPSPDRRFVAFVRPASNSSGTGNGSDLYVRSLANGTETRIARDDVNINGIRA